jgi:NAD(P)-dependent dehydrogenase (short-subunit alcohol dehydrogenase family)
MGTMLVTGSASGIGAAVQAELTAAGHRVLGLDLAGADIEADLSTPEGRRHAVDATAERCAGGLDGMVLCAGLGPQVSDATRIVAVNLFGTLAVLDGLFPLLRNGSDPSAVVVSSVSSTMVDWQDNPIREAVEAGDESAVGPVLQAAGEYRGQIAYAGSKNALTVAVRRRVAEWGAAGVRLNTVAPGSVETPLLDAGRRDPLYGKAISGFSAPIARHGRPAEIAGLIGYLMGPAAGFIHGAQFVIDGGVDALIRPTAF